MGTRDSILIVVLVAILAAVSFATAAQTQNQQSQNQNQAQQNQSQNQNQGQQNQGQPAQKQSFWQKLKNSAMQGAQNAVQQGSQQVQQGTQQVQQGAQQGVQQGVQGLEQGAQQTVSGGNQGNAAFGGSGAGSRCGPSCFDAGPFQANVSQMTMSQQGGWHVIRMNIQFRNSTNQPLIIAYHEGSMVMVDNNGATYQAAGGSPGELQGMGIDRGNQTDSQFVLGPGQTGSALFSVARWRDATSPVGTGYSYNLTIDELQAQNGAMAIPVRSYNLNFPTLSPSTTSAGFPSGSPAKGFAGGSTGTSYAGAAAPAAQSNSQALGAAVQQAGPAGKTPASPALNSAAMKSTAATTVKPSPAVRPIATTTTTKKPTTTTKTNQTNQANTTKPNN